MTIFNTVSKTDTLCTGCVQLPTANKRKRFDYQYGWILAYRFDEYGDKLSYENSIKTNNRADRHAFPGGRIGFFVAVECNIGSPASLRYYGR